MDGLSPIFEIRGNCVSLDFPQIRSSIIPIVLSSNPYYFLFLLVEKLSQWFSMDQRFSNTDSQWILETQTIVSTYLSQFNRKQSMVISFQEIIHGCFFSWVKLVDRSLSPWKLFPKLESLKEY